MKLLNSIYKTLKKIVKILGFDFVIKKRRTGNYEAIFPQADYAPWLADDLFNHSYAMAKDYTKVDKYRCYELWQLVEQSAKLNGALMEIGVWRGGVLH